MEEKNIALCILGVIAVIAVVGLIMMFTAEKATARTAQVYPNSVVSPTVEQPTYVGYGVGPGVQYYTSSGQPVVTPANIPYEPAHWKTVEGQR